MLPIAMENPVTDFLRHNAALMDQAIEVLTRTPDGTYSQRSTTFRGQRIGAQVRHVIEFYECLFDGIQRRQVNYDARRRDPVIESDRRAAIGKLRAIRERLLSDEMLLTDCSLWIAPEGGAASDAFSSLGRELQAVESHTVHHYALIAMLMLASGIEVPQNFGVSRATTRYWAETAARTEAA